MANDIDGLLAENRRMREALCACVDVLDRINEKYGASTSAEIEARSVLSAAPEPPTADAIAARQEGGA